MSRIVMCSYFRVYRNISFEKDESVLFMEVSQRLFTTQTWHSGIWTDECLVYGGVLNFNVCSDGEVSS